MKKFTWTTVDAMSCCNLPVLLCVLGWAARLPNRLGCDLERGHMQLAKNVGRYFSTRQDELERRSTSGDRWLGTGLTDDLVRRNLPELVVLFVPLSYCYPPVYCIETGVLFVSAKTGKKISKSEPYM